MNIEWYMEVQKLSFRPVNFERAIRHPGGESG